MTALGKLFRTTAFKLSASYLAVFTVFAAFVLGYVAWSARGLFDEQILSTIEAEANGLAEQYRVGGIHRLVGAIDGRARDPGASLYLVTTFNGQRLAGNIGAIPVGALDAAGNREIAYARREGSDAAAGVRRALVRIFVLPGGFRLLVGRDLEERERLSEVIRRAIGLSLALVTILACLGGWFITRRVLKRVDDMTETTATIMAGDLAGRLAIAGTGDELDRLAHNLNAMLERIGELMTGLKEVSDNIAHDLKTPLSRLRNRVEEALRTGKSPDDYAKALEATIEDADDLIRIFDALLMIARLEARGGTPEAMTDFDAAEVARSVADLYEPLAEEAGVPLAVNVEAHLPVHGSRELLGQALANLVDNALKYGVLNTAPGSGDADTTGANAPVCVTAKLAASRVEIAVADRGPGIPAAERGRVLERFARLEGARTRPGFGLGLSLAAAVARLHEGELRLEDNAPGLRAVIALPMKARA